MGGDEPLQPRKAPQVCPFTSGLHPQTRGTIISTAVPQPCQTRRATTWRSNPYARTTPRTTPASILLGTCHHDPQNPTLPNGDTHHSMAPHSSTHGARHTRPFPDQMQECPTTKSRRTCGPCQPAREASILIRMTVLCHVGDLSARVAAAPQQCRRVPAVPFHGRHGGSS